MALYKTLAGWGVNWRDEFGRRHRRFVGSEEAAKALEAQLRTTSAEARLRIAALSTGAGLKLNEAYELYLAHCGNIAPGTKARHRYIAAILQRHIGNPELAQITPALLSDYLKHRATEVAPATLHSEASTLKNLFRFLREQDHTAQDLAMAIKPGHRPQAERKQPITYDDECASKSSSPSTPGCATEKPSASAATTSTWKEETSSSTPRNPGPPQRASCHSPTDSPPNSKKPAPR